MKADLRKRMRSTKDAVFTPEEMAILEDSDDEEEAELQRLVSAQKVGAVVVDYLPSAAVDSDLKSHVNLPSQSEMNELLLAEKRKALLARLSTL